MRVGRFALASGIIESVEAVEIFKKLAFVPLRAERISYPDVFEYTGLSKFFDDIEEGLIIPIYNITLVLETPDGDMYIEVSKA